MWWSVVECGGVCWSDEMKCDGWSHQPQKVTSTLKSHINSKSKKNPKKNLVTSKNAFFDLIVGNKEKKMKKITPV